MTDFSDSDRELLHGTDEVNIETRGGKAIPIWIVVANNDVYVRSVKGPNGAWWKRLSNGETARLAAGGTTWTVRGEAASQQEVDAVSDALRTKYESRWAGPTEAMLRPETLPTTLRLLPA